MPFIYTITHTPSGTKYVGLTKQFDPYIRWKQHLCRAHNDKKDTAIHNAMNQCGCENFSFNIIEECNYKELEDREAYWINTLDTYNNGFNMTIPRHKWGTYNRFHKLPAPKIRSAQSRLGSQSDV